MKLRTCCGAYAHSSSTQSRLETVAGHLSHSDTLALDHAVAPKADRRVDTLAHAPGVGLNVWTAPRPLHMHVEMLCNIMDVLYYNSAKMTRKLQLP